MPGPFENGPLSFEAPPTRAPVTARYLNPATGDYERESDGEYVGMPPVRQRVLLALKTIAGSAWPNPSFGNPLLRIQKIDQHFEARARSGVLTALRQLLAIEKVIRVEAITFRRVNSGHVEVTVQYIDLTTGLPDRAVV